MAAKPSLANRPAWKRAIKEAASPKRVGDNLAEWEAEGQAASLRGVSPDHARVLSALFSGSTLLSQQLLAHPDWLDVLTPENLAHPRKPQGLKRELANRLQPFRNQGDTHGAWHEMRRFQRSELCRIATRDLARLGDALEITRELSNLADTCLSAGLELCRAPLAERLGQPYHQDPDGRWQPTEFCVLGLGKLGGQELNYSSDIDLMFIYSEEGFLFSKPPRKGASSGQGMDNASFFRRVAEAFVAEMTASTDGGRLYRVDLRLRPEGDSGPLVRSLSGCENYYAEWGQTWERMMLIKARCVAGECGLAEEFLELIQAFRFPRFLSKRVLDEMADMKDRIESEVVRAGELERNVKLGRGGIRDIEFIVQTSQLMHAGNSPFLQGSQTVPVLQKMVQYQLVTEDEAAILSQAYRFFRDVEHRVQMEAGLQSHTIPGDLGERTRLGALMGFKDAKAFEAARRRHADGVRRIYHNKLKARPEAAEEDHPRDLQQHAESWKQTLADHGFCDVPGSFRLLSGFVMGPGFIHVSSRTTELAWELVPRLLALCPKRTRTRRSTKMDAESRVLSDPDRVLARLDSFVSNYGARAMLFETWTHHPDYFVLLLLLFDRSEFLATMALRTPDLVDDLVLSGRLNRSKSAEETLADLRHGLRDKDQHLWIRRYQQAELMRIGLRDILGLSDFQRNLEELSNLADACLNYALDVVMKRHRIKKPPFTIIGLGKLGGRELNFGSDLDVVFIAPDKAAKLSGRQRLASELMELLHARTELGQVYEVDARLRPDGESGLLVNTLEGFETYYRERAELWEIQALSRTRPVAGDPRLGEQFQSLAAALTNFSTGHVRKKFPGPTPGRTGLAAWSRDWLKEIAAMRLRIEKERTTPGEEGQAIKTGAGGLIDVEFIAQAICMREGWQEANTLTALERIRDQRALSVADSKRLIENYRHLRRIEGILRRWSLEGESALPSDPAPYHRVAVRCGFSSSETMRRDLARWRREIRKVYHKVFRPA